MNNTSIYKLSGQYFRRFVTTISEILTEENRAFDLITGSGNTGVIMVKFTELIYKQLGTIYPSTLLIPSYRNRDEHGKTISVDIVPFITDIKEKLSPSLEINTKEILFVDDEIGSGGQAGAIIDLLLETAWSEQIPESARYTIVAADHRFDVTKFYPQIHVDFRPFIKAEPSVYNIITHLAGSEVENMIQKFILPRDHTGSFGRHALSVLLDLPMKTLTDGNPQWTNEHNRLAENGISNLQHYKNDFLKYLNTLITEELTKNHS